MVCLVSNAKSTATPPSEAFSGIAELFGRLCGAESSTVKFDPNLDSNNVERSKSEASGGGAKKGLENSEVMLGLCEPQQDYCACGLIKKKYLPTCCGGCVPGAPGVHTPTCDVMNDGFGVHAIMASAKGEKCRDCKVRPANGKWGNCCSACKRGCHTNECSERIVDSPLMNDVWSEYRKKKKSVEKTALPILTTLNEMLDSAGDVAEDFTELTSLEDTLPDPDSLPKELGIVIVKLIGSISVLSESISDVQNEIREAILISSRDGAQRSVGGGKTRHEKPSSAKQALRKTTGGKPGAGK
jgi:hypothetical protein